MITIMIIIATYKRGLDMSMNELVLKIKVDRVIEIEQHLDWASNYGLSDDDTSGWEFCKKLELEKDSLIKEIDKIKKFI